MKKFSADWIESRGKIIFLIFIPEMKKNICEEKQKILCKRKTTTPPDCWMMSRRYQRPDDLPAERN